MAGPLRGGGDKGQAIKEKLYFFLFCCHLKIKMGLLLDNLSKYGHITFKFVGILSGLLRIFQKIVLF